MAHAAQWKKTEVKEIETLVKEYPVIGVVNLGSVPAKQMQKIRGVMRSEGAQIRMSRKRLLTKALKDAKKEGVERLSEHFTGQPGLLFTKANPFKIYKILAKNRTRAPVKPNSIAASDIMVSKGDTSFPPGPILSELQQAGIPAAIQGGKVTIKEDKVIVKAGERVSPAVAGALARLEIEPVEIKLDLLAAFEQGTIYTPEVLAIDSQKIFSDLTAAHQQAVNLSLNSFYLTKETAAIGVSLAAAKARNLAVNAGIFEKDIMNVLLAKAHATAQALEALTREKVKSKEGQAT